MSKSIQEDAGEERVTAKSKRCSERDPNVLASTASECPGKTRSESQIPLSSWTEQQPRTGRLVMDGSSPDYSEWNIVDKTWSSQEWKSDELMDDRTERAVVIVQHTDQFIVENDETNSYAEAESELSLGYRSFLHRVNDEVRKRQTQSSKDATKDSDKHSVIWRMFVSSTLQASVFMGKNYSENLHSVRNTEDLTMKQVFDIPEKLIVGQSDETFGVTPSKWEDSSWHQSLACKGLRILRFCVMSWKGESEPNIQSRLGRQIDVVQKFATIQNFGHN